MEELELNIRVDLDLRSCVIRKGMYNTLDYECDSLDEVGEIVQEYINEYIKEK